MELLITSILAFASSNVDDIFILILFFGNEEYEAKEVFIGQYLGIIALIVISLIGSFIGVFFNQQYVGLLGLLPVYFGLKRLFQPIKQKREEIKKGVNK